MADIANFKQIPAEEASVKRKLADVDDDDSPLNATCGVKEEIDIGHTIIQPTDLHYQMKLEPVKDEPTETQNRKRAATSQSCLARKHPQLDRSLAIRDREPSGLGAAGQVQASASCSGSQSDMVARVETCSSSNVDVAPASGFATAELSVAVTSSTQASALSSAYTPFGEGRDPFQEMIENELFGLSLESEDSDEDNNVIIDHHLARTYNFQLEDGPQASLERAQEDANDVDEVAEANDPLYAAYTMAEDEALEEEVASSDQTSFAWSKDFSTYAGEKETFRVPHGPTISCTDPTQCFLSIWDEAIMQHIVDETNRYAQSLIDLTELTPPQSRMNRWEPTNLAEMYTLFQIFILQSVIALANEREYWYPACEWLNTSFTCLMTFNRFSLLKRLLHFVDNSTIVAGDKVAKIQPIVDHCNNKFQSLYSLRQDISINESLTLWKGKLSFLQYIRTKATKFGLNTYELCESKTGYLWNFYIYTGKESQENEEGSTNTTAPPTLATTKIVLRLMDKLYNRGHVLWMNNFYQCPLLARLLKSRGTDCVGTLRCNRKNVPRQLSVLRKEDLPRNMVIALHSGDVMVMSWKDANKVSMISTYHHGNTAAPVRQGGRIVYKPTVVLNYNANMGSVDLKDQRLSNFLMERLCNRKWYIKIFKRLLNTSILNSYIIYCESIARMPEGDRPKALLHREFRYAIANGLNRRSAQNVAPNVPASPSVVNMANRPMLGYNNHEALKITKGTDKVISRECIYCKHYGNRSRTTLACNVCMVPLCAVPCFYNFHHVREFSSVEKRVHLDEKRVMDIPVKNNL